MFEELAMKTKYFLPVVAILFAACSDATAPLDLHVAAARQTTPPPTSGGETFDNGIASLGAWSPLQLATSPGSTKLAPTSFLGRFADEVVSLNVPAGASSVTISFDLYIIGTWDGAGQQGFGSDRWQIEVSRDGAAPENIFHTSFSNQATKPQNFPRDINGGTGPNDKGASAVATLGYPKGAGKYDVGDATYHLTYTVSNPGAGALTFLFHRTTPSQDLNDESWGLDNVLVTRN
jgi:hypothetical protein